MNRHLICRTEPGLEWAELQDASTITPNREGVGVSLSIAVHTAGHRNRRSVSQVQLQSIEYAALRLPSIAAGYELYEQSTQLCQQEKKL